MLIYDYLYSAVGLTSLTCWFLSAGLSLRYPAQPHLNSLLQTNTQQVIKVCLQQENLIIYISDLSLALLD